VNDTKEFETGCGRVGKEATGIGVLAEVAVGDRRPIADFDFGIAATDDDLGSTFIPL